MSRTLRSLQLRGGLGDRYDRGGPELRQKETGTSAGFSTKSLMTLARQSPCAVAGRPGLLGGDEGRHPLKCDWREQRRMWGGVNILFLRWKNLDHLFSHLLNACCMTGSRLEASDNMWFGPHVMCGPEVRQEGLPVC